MKEPGGIVLLLCLTVIQSDSIIVNVLLYKNITVPNIHTVCLNFRSVVSVSEHCVQQLEIVCGNSTLLMTSKCARLERVVLDATSTFPYSGMGYSSRTDYGNYDQCMTIDHSYKGGRILGEHCTFGLVIPDLQGNLTDVNSYFHLAVCRPNSCRASDYNAVLSHLTSTPLPRFQDVGCQTVESNTSFNAGDVIVLSIFVIFTMLMIASTAYDTYLYTTGLNCSHPLFLSFSMLTNGRNLLHISRGSASKEQIEVFNGIKVISMMWIVASHANLTWQHSAVRNLEKLTWWVQQLFTIYIKSAIHAVDSFFFMSGFLVAFSYFKGKIGTLKKQIYSIPRVIIHRYIRITPALLMIYLFTMHCYIHMGSGPVWTLAIQGKIDTCKTFWWKFFLYIQNYNDNIDNICLNHTWYLSVDMQLFLLSPLILIPLSLQLKSMGFKVVMVELTMWNIFWIFLPMTTKLVFSGCDKICDTRVRAINYYLGMMLGLFMRVKIDKPFLYMINEKRRSTVNLIMWFLTILNMLTVTILWEELRLHGGYNIRSVFEALMRPAWCIGLCWITYSCYHGHGGFVNWILCRSMFQVLSRLTYCIFLTHASVIIYHAGTARDKWYFSDYQQVVYSQRKRIQIILVLTSAVIGSAGLFWIS